MPIPQATPPADNDELLWAQDEYLARLFATSPRFQTEVGAVDTEAALAHVIDWADIGDDFEDARILVRMDGGMTRQKTGLGCWKTTGNIPVFIERKQDEFVESNDNYRTSKAEFRAFYSKVLRELETKLDERVAILGFNPIEIASYSIVTGPWMIPASETPRYDEEDVGTPTALKGKVHWWVEIGFDIY